MRREGTEWDITMQGADCFSLSLSLANIIENGNKLAEQHHSESWFIISLVDCLNFIIRKLAYHFYTIVKLIVKSILSTMQLYFWHLKQNLIWHMVLLLVCLALLSNLLKYGINSIHSNNKLVAKLNFGVVFLCQLRGQLEVQLPAYTVYLEIDYWLYFSLINASYNKWDYDLQY